ncbi:hypothetical protein AL714_11590 [Clostridium botulinum]|uniref:hypothetical protein n=1 Tax=Clostridium botulinum TaxID=1491 RepID=UPI00099DD861|nr:hypothetical protein [Clostridium botulinum]MCC5440354.1 hypothetical protein [Clostridium botulinum]NFR57662.1 hypothetical protein [Clostridium botulinum]OPD36814.1 hypothetical protein AL714_11590 [Clostridium botulinum]
MKIDNLKKAIKEQRDTNVRLFNSIPIPTREDPNNTKAEPILKLWREGSNKIKEMIKELQILESKNRKRENKDVHKVFINGYGEATNREITNSSYQRNQKRLAKDMLNYIK